MAFARARALRTLQSSLRNSGQRVGTRVSAPGRTQLVSRRYASGGGHGGDAGAASTSDLPWAIGAVAVTIPSCWYLWPDSSQAEAGHHGLHKVDPAEPEREDGSSQEENEAPKEDLEEAGPAVKAYQKLRGKEADEKFEEKEEKEQDAEPTKDKEGDAQDSMPPGGEDKKEDDSKDDDSEDKGESGESKVAPGGGESKDNDSGEESKGGDESQNRDSPPKAPAEGKNFRTGAGPGEESERTRSSSDKKGKREDLNPEAHTSHSHNIKDSPEKSNKAEGIPETAAKGSTVDPARPQK